MQNSEIVIEEKTSLWFLWQKHEGRKLLKALMYNTDFLSLVEKMTISWQK